MTTQLERNIAAIKGWTVQRREKAKPMSQIVGKITNSLMEEYFILVDKQRNPINTMYTTTSAGYPDEDAAWLDCPAWQTSHYDAMKLWDGVPNFAIITDPASNGQLWVPTWSPAGNKPLKGQAVFFADLPEELSKLWYEREIRIVEQRSREIEGLQDNIATLEARLKLLQSGGI